MEGDLAEVLAAAGVERDDVLVKELAGTITTFLETGVHLWDDSVPTLRELRARESAGSLTQPVEQLADSYVHMHVNRMLRTAARAQELVLYDLLHRLYESRAARQRHAGAGGSALS